MEQAGDIQVVAEARDVDEGCALFTRHAPDLTVTDLFMPGSSGLELIRRLRERSPQARALVFSMHDSEIFVRRALEGGALGFVSKSSAPECIVDAVHAAAAGRRYLSPGLSPSLLQRPVAPNLFEALTQRELEVFRLLSRGDSLADCARSLHLSPKTVSNHQSLIKEKLGTCTTAAMAHLALRHGMIQAAGF